MEWAFVIAVVGVAVLAIALAGRLSRSKLQELTDDWPPETRAQFRRMEARQAELEALVRWFGEGIVKPKDKYAELSAEIWKTWNEPS